MYVDAVHVAHSDWGVLASAKLNECYTEECERREGVELQFGFAMEPSTSTGPSTLRSVRTYDYKGRIASVLVWWYVFNRPEA